MKIVQSVLFGIMLTGSLAAQQSDTNNTGTSSQRPAGTQNSGPQTAKPREMKPLGPQKTDINRGTNTTSVTIPANAERIDSLHYRAKDDKGVVWNYTKTPFGINKEKADEETKPMGSSKQPEIIATDQGDSVKFERRTPFGKNVWTKKKTDLDDSEKAALAASSNHAVASQPKN